MRRFFAIAFRLVVVVIAAAGVAYAVAVMVATSRYEKQWDVHEASFPVPWPAPGGAPDSVALERAIERGSHLVNSRLGCAGCHAPDLGGSVVVDVPIVGRWVAPNLTRGAGGVTHAFTANDWDRAVRHGVRHNGRTSSMPSEEFMHLSDHELSDVIAYARSLPPIDRDLGKVKFGPVFTILAATDPKLMVAFHLDHQKPHAAEPPPEGPTAEFGAHIVPVCRGCHGANLSGGRMQGDPNMPIVANLTPHASGIRGWTEADFVRSMREGKRPDGSAIAEQMPWRVYGQMTDTELSALWAYLETLPAIEKGKR